MTTLENAHLQIQIAAAGAELRSIKTRADDAEWLWQGDPAWWSGRSPLLFPVVGQSPQGNVTIGDVAYPMGSHGFARHSEFQISDSSAHSATFTLRPNAATRASYPFDFSLEITYRLQADTLICTARVGNHDNRPMPFQFGFHPAFVWPLPHHTDMLHHVTLENGATPPMRRPDAAGLIAPALLATPFKAGKLHVRAEDFQSGAMVFAEGAGHAFGYGAGGAQVQMTVRNLPNFALWQKPGAAFLCLEPWHGTAPFADQGPELADRPDALTLAPGEGAEFGMDLRILPG